MKIRIRNNEKGMLLFTVVVSIVVSFICAALLLLVLNQCRMIDAECKRKQALQWLKAGANYAQELCESGAVTSVPHTAVLPDNSDVTITIDSPSTGAPTGVIYTITIETIY